MKGKLAHHASTARSPTDFMTEAELARLGDGKEAYIKVMTSAQAHVLFPAIEGLPSGINVFVLHGADGTPIALTDNRDAAIGHALGDDLEVVSVH